MKYTKKLLALFLSVILSLTLFTPTYALENGNASIDEVSNAMKTVKNSLTQLSDTASNIETNTIASYFTSFMDVARTTGTILTAVNGSAIFLRMIGVLSDPTQTKLDGILSQLKTIDERLSSMDDKLNDLTTMMSELKASVEFNARTQKAILYEGSWRDFEYRYMESGLDAYMAQYDSNIKSNLMRWCNGYHYENNVDNRSIYVLYDAQGNDYRLVFSNYNGVPANTNCWVKIPETLLPSTFSYNINSFNQDLASAIKNNITNNPSLLETYNYTFDTNRTIETLAADAVNTLVYRVASGFVNGSSTFASDVSRVFSNYCTHLQNSGDGIDATLKTFYLTHAFEMDVAQDIKDFCDRMIIITGTYGMFVANVLGMSQLTTDEEKIIALNRMTAAIKTLDEAKKNGITGDGNYCYVTGTKLVYSTIKLSACAELTAHYTMSNTTLESYKGNKPTATYGVNSQSGAVPIGDVGMIILANTLASNGVSVDHEYLNTSIGNSAVDNLGPVVTAYSDASTFTIDGKTKLHVKKAFGSYFSDGSTISSLPSDADDDDVLFRKKISGSLYDLNSMTLTSNATLCAIAVYGENHWYWVTDEGAFMGGPSTNSAFYDDYVLAKIGSDSTGVIRKHTYNMSTSYNTILSIPCESLYNTAEDKYNPLTFIKDITEPSEGHNELIDNDEDYQEKQVIHDEPQQSKKVSESKQVEPASTIDNTISNNGSSSSTKPNQNNSSKTETDNKGEAADPNNQGKTNESTVTPATDPEKQDDTSSQVSGDEEVKQKQNYTIYIVLGLSVIALISLLVVIKKIKKH